MDINYGHIAIISEALCWADQMFIMKIQELRDNGLDNVAKSYEQDKDKVKEAHDSLQLIRKELHLKDDYAYKEKFGK